MENQIKLRKTSMKKMLFEKKGVFKEFKITPELEKYFETHPNFRKKYESNMRTLNEGEMRVILHFASPISITDPPPQKIPQIVQNDEDFWNSGLSINCEILEAK